jgi:hypothetical protein
MIWHPLFKLGARFDSLSKLSEYREAGFLSFSVRTCGGVEIEWSESLPKRELQRPPLAFGIAFESVPLLLSTYVFALLAATGSVRSPLCASAMSDRCLLLLETR